MKKTIIRLSVADAVDQISKALVEKGFKIFADIDHQAQAKGVDLEMPASRVLIFGNPVVGTKLMKTDIAISLDLPLRLAIVDSVDGTLIVHQTSEDYRRNYKVENHPVLEKVEALFATLIADL